MNKFRWLATGWFILCLLLGSIHCAGEKSQLREEASWTPLKKGVSPPPSGIPAPPPKSVVEAPPPAATEAPRAENPAQPAIQAPRPTLPGPPAASSSVKPPEASRAPGVVLNFDNADLYEVIRVMGEILKITYMIDPRVRGVVNIHTVGQIPSEDIFPIFQSILKLNGATAVKKGNIYEIVPFGDAKKSYVLPSTTRDPAKLVAEERYTTQIIILKYIPVAEVSKIIKPFLSDGADIIEHPPNNILIINDLASNVRKSLDIINLFDVDLFADMKVRIYPILNADVTEIAKEMERIFASFEVSTKSGRGVGITFTPIARINSLLVISAIPNIFDKVEAWLRELDKTPAEGTKLSVFVYYVQNGKAKDIADVLKQIFVSPKEKKPEFKEKVVTPEPTPRGVRPPAPTPAPAAPPKEEAATVPEGEINIVVDETNNALVIRAFQRDYRAIVETIRKLDIYPKQVLIEVLLAEVTLDETTQFGIEWSRFLSSQPPNAQEVAVGARPPADPFSTALTAIGIRYSIVELGGRVSAAIRAAATRGRLRVISSPHILASNNKEAKIQIGSSQPILTSTYTTTATASTNVVEGTIEYKDIGIILTVTPRISDGGLVSMEISIEDSSVDTTALGTLPSVPVFGKRTAKTVLSVTEGQSIVIGGLIQDSKNVTKSGIPILSRIPILGALFGTHRYVTGKTELILLMTPHIITDQIQSESVTREFREKVEGIKRELEKKIR
ncbi:MAG: type II secretion system secretin GspD [Thermodesulfobacteriota bacterium]